MSRTVFIFLNGILNNPGSAAGWTDRAVTWIHNHTAAVAEKYEYYSGALTRRFTLDRHADQLAALVARYRSNGRRVVLAGHSNGGEILVRMVSRHPELEIDELHFIAAACEADFERNGLNAALAAGRVGGVTCYCSRRDGALKLARWTSLFRWIGLGYGYLGLVGPQRARPLHRVITVWRDDLDHSGWFTPEANFAWTLDQIAADELR